MDNGLEKAKQKRIKRNRIVITIVIYFMLISILAGVTYGGKIFGDNSAGYIIAGVVIGIFTICYWLFFYVAFRREKQRKKTK